MLHLPTVISLSFILNLIIGLYFISIYQYKKQTSFLYFGLACTTFTFAILCASLRVIIAWPFITHYFASLFIIACPLFLIMGLKALSPLNKSICKQVSYLLIVAAVFLLVVYNTAVEKILVSLTVAGLFLYASYIVLSTRFIAKLQQRMLLLCLLLHALVMLIQGVLLLLPFFTALNFNFASVLQFTLAVHLILATSAALLLPFLVFANTEHTLNSLANRDPLTQLLNKRGLNAVANTLFSKNNAEHPLSIIMVDIDFFKRVNDEFGHDAGDEAIKWVSQHIAELFSNSAVTARVGGEEFAILLNHCTLNEAQCAANTLRKNIKNKPFSYYGNTIYLRISAGVACSDTQTSSFKSLLSAADKRLYIAKTTGRDKVIYESAQNPFINNKPVCT